jgi:hypothetical protein
MNQRQIAVLLLSGLLALPGCAGRASTGNISGVVKYKGEPVTAGTVSFFAETNAVCSGQIDRDGNYTVIGVPTGNAKITVQTPRADIRMPGGESPPKTISIPTKYFDQDQSGLTHLVTKGQQTRDLNLD